MVHIAILKRNMGILDKIGALFVDRPSQVGMKEDKVVAPMHTIKDNKAIEPIGSASLFMDKAPARTPTIVAAKTVSKAPKIVSSQKGLYGDVHTLVDKLGEDNIQVVTPPKRLQSTIQNTYKRNPELPKGLLETILMAESSMGSVTKNKNGDIGDFAYLVGFTPAAKQELIRNGIIPDLNSHEGVLQAVADFYKIKKDFRNEDGSIRHTYDNMAKWYNERYSSGKLKPEVIEKFDKMYNYYANS